jgi:hypothetical protein
VAVGPPLAVAQRPSPGLRPYGTVTTVAAGSASVLPTAGSPVSTSTLAADALRPAKTS